MFIHDMKYNIKTYTIYFLIPQLCCSMCSQSLFFILAKKPIFHVI